MVKAHNKSRRDLLLMNVTMLKDMIRKHNLDNAIKRYSSMRKADLVDALMKHSTKPNLVIEEEKPVPKKAAPKKAAPKKAAPKKEEDDDLEDDFFANIGKGKGAIKKTPMSASYLASKKALRELRLKDPAAYQAKISAEAAAQKAKGNSLEEFDMKKKAAREAEAAAKKAAKKKPAAKKKAAAPKKKAAAKKDFVYMIPGLAVLGEDAVKQQRKAEAFAKDYLKRLAAFNAGTAESPGYPDYVKYKRGMDETRRLAREIKKTTPEGIAKQAALLKAREKKNDREAAAKYVKQKREREDARAAKRKEKAAEKALRDADPKKVAAAAKRKATILAKVKAELKRKYPYLTDADAEAIVKIQGTRKEENLLNAETRKIGDIRVAAQKRAGIK